MKYLFFDIECANCYSGNGKIYSFGYVLTDENFNVLCGPEDLLINPNSSFDPYVKKNILAYDKELFKEAPKFNEVYEKITSLMTESDTLCFGYGITNDLRFLQNDCKRYQLPYIHAKVCEIQKLIEFVEGNKARKLDVEYVERIGDNERNAHRSDEDAFRTAKVAQCVCEKFNKKLHEYFLQSGNYVMADKSIVKRPKSHKNENKTAIKEEDC